MSMKRLVDYPRLYDSTKLAALSTDELRTEYVWLLGIAGPNGSFEWCERNLWAAAYASVRERSLEDLSRYLQAFVDAGLLLKWEQDGKPGVISPVRRNRADCPGRAGASGSRNLAAWLLPRQRTSYSIGSTALSRLAKHATAVSHSRLKRASLTLQACLCLCLSLCQSQSLCLRPAPHLS